MPTYEYACSSCGERLEVVQRFSDDPLTTCPACQGALRKVFSAVGVVFKGSGFYKTDSRSSGKSAKTGGADSTSSTSSAESKSDSGSSGSAGGGGTKPVASTTKDTPSGQVA
jgi:putative FmdB family regulatory protein